MVGLLGLAPVRFSSSFSLYPGLALAIPEPDGCEGVLHRLAVAGTGAGFSWLLLLLLLVPASWFSSVIARG
jgi:hypothetical protein